MTLGLAEFQVCKVLKWGMSLGLCSPSPPLLPSLPASSQDLRDTNGSSPTCITPKLLLPASSCGLYSYHSWLRQGAVDSSLHTPEHPISQPPAGWTTTCWGSPFLKMFSLSFNAYGVLPTCTCVYACSAHGGQKNGFGFPGAGATDGCEPPYECWESSLDLPDEQLWLS